MAGSRSLFFTPHSACKRRFLAANTANTAVLYLCACVSVCAPMRLCASEFPPSGVLAVLHPFERLQTPIQTEHMNRTHPPTDRTATSHVAAKPMIHFDKNDRLVTTDDLVLTGRKRSGKTHLAKRCSHDVLGYMDACEIVCMLIIGHTDRSRDPDVRPFLCNLGAIGCGEAPRRRMNRDVDWTGLTTRLRRDGHELTHMGSSQLWEQFGSTGFWIDLMEARVEEQDSPVVIHNARFPREVDRFTEHHGFRHLHVMASEQTRRERLEAEGDTLTPDVWTEQLAKELDAVARERDVRAGSGSMTPDLPVDIVRGVADRESVVWSDPKRDPDLDLSTNEPTATKAQRAPNGRGEDVASLVREDVEARVQEGEDEYGERLTTHNGRDALVDAYQEALDLALYLRQTIAERET